MRATSGWRTMSALVQARDGNTGHAAQHALRLHQAAELRLGQVDLAHVAGDHRLGAKAHAGQKHLHLLGRGVLRLVQNHKGVVQRAPAHKGQRCDFQRLALERLVHLVEAHQVVQRVVQRAQVGVNLLRSGHPAKSPGARRLPPPGGSAQCVARRCAAVRPPRPPPPDRFCRCLPGQCPR